MVRIVKEEYPEETRYVCEELISVEGVKTWKPILKYDFASGRYYPAIYTSLKLAERFIKGYCSCDNTTVVYSR